MFWNRYFIPSFLVMLVVVAFHWLGSLQDFYSTTEWYDFPMHFVGGAWVALFTLWALSTQYGAKLLRFLTVRNLIVFVFVFGALWEVLELALHFTNVHDIGYLWDTTHDLIMDVLGAALVSLIYKKHI